MNRALVKAHQPAFAIGLFLILYCCILYAKPSFIFNKDGSFRQFGVGRSRKTVIPIWLLAFIIGILAYLAVAYYVAHPQLSAIE
mgnify:CR=1 FL=1|tara:strand:- start:500 stop:751 length:252 start_codon:yes stop_codon:yes gene_type:complete